MQTLIKPQEVVNTGLYRAAPVNARFDINLISPYILSTEERFLIPVLGRAFYDDLVAEQNTAVSNYNPDAGALVNKFVPPAPAPYETLWVSYLLRYAAYTVYYEALPFITFQVASKGIFLNDSEFAQNGGAQAFKIMQDNMMQKIDNLKEYLVKFLCQNKGDYPLFDAKKHCPCDSGCDDCGCGSNPYLCNYYSIYGVYCNSCQNKRNPSTNIIFYR